MKIFCEKIMTLNWYKNPLNGAFQSLTLSFENLLFLLFLYIKEEKEVRRDFHFNFLVDMFVFLFSVLWTLKKFKDNTFYIHKNGMEKRNITQNFVNNSESISMMVWKIVLIFTMDFIAPKAALCYCIRGMLHKMYKWWMCWFVGTRKMVIEILDGKCSFLLFI